jgi:transcriptional antiterminator
MLLSERIVNYAKIKLGKRLNDSIYVTLPDHISGAIPLRDPPQILRQRILSNNYYEEDSSELLEVIKYKHNKAFKCVEKVKQFVLDKYGFELSGEEMLYLTVHISRLIKDLK